MPLTVETGAGVPGADSFITVAQFDATCAGLFAVVPSDPGAQKEAAIRRAWLYLKSLSWIETFPTLGGSIPSDVLMAQGILARYELASPSGLAPSVVPGQQKVLVRAGEIGWQVTGQSGVDAQRAVVTMAADLLKPYLASRAGFLLRA